MIGRKKSNLHILKANQNRLTTCQNTHHRSTTNLIRCNLVAVVDVQGRWIPRGKHFRSVSRAALVYVSHSHSATKQKTLEHWFPLLPLLLEGILFRGSVSWKPRFFFSLYHLSIIYFWSCTAEAVAASTFSHMYCITLIIGFTLALSMVGDSGFAGSRNSKKKSR